MKVFISYRRDDSGFATDRIHEACKAYVDDPADIFMDIDGIPPGADFVEFLERKVAECDMLFAVIGRDWMTITNPKTGGPRIQDPDDFVHIEIASALRRGIPVVPLLVGEAELPKASDLPDDLKTLTRRNARTLDRLSFESQIDDLMRSLGFSRTGAAAAIQSKPGPPVLAIGLSVLAVAVLALGAFVLNNTFTGGDVVEVDTPETADLDGSLRTPKLGLRMNQGDEPVRFSSDEGTEFTKRPMVASIDRSGFEVSVPGKHWDNANAEEPTLRLVITDKPGILSWINPRETLRDESPFGWFCAGARERFGSPRVFTTSAEGTLENGSPCGHVPYTREMFDTVTEDERSFEINFIADLDDGFNSETNLLETGDRLYLVFYIENGDGSSGDLNDDPNRLDVYEVEFVELEFED